MPMDRDVMWSMGHNKAVTIDTIFSSQYPYQNILNAVGIAVTSNKVSVCICTHNSSALPYEMQV